MVEAFFTRGWCRFGTDPALERWLAGAIPTARAAIEDPAKSDWRCGRTWFAGVNALDNDATGAVRNSGPLLGRAASFIHSALGQRPGWDKAQISVIRPGYPQPSDAEAPAAFAYRRDRDAAHVDGLLPIGAEKRRMLREPHGFVLGLPISDCDDRASPLVVWEGSHEIMRAAFAHLLRPHPVADWPGIDLTDAYHAARRRCFADCPRVAVHARPGEAYLVHRLALHGVALWQDGARAPAEGRIIAYFRPEIAGGAAAWLENP